MKNWILGAAVLLSPVLAVAADGPDGEKTFVHLVGENGKPSKVPLFSASSAPVARAGAETITVADLATALGNAHEAAAADAQPRKKDATAILERLIDARLVVQEARAMGIAELPEVKAAMAEFEEKTGRELLQQKATESVRPDALAVERAYHRAAKEWKVSSVLFAKHEDAVRFASAVAPDASFDAAAEKAVQDGKATSAKRAEFLPRRETLPQIVEALLPLEKGAVTTPIQVAGGFAVMRIEDERHPENAQLRARVEAESLAARQKEALKEYYAKLVGRYVTTNEALLQKLDYHAAKPGLAALKKDGRILARVRGGGSIKVADLTAELEARFFHGMEGAIKKSQVNLQKPDALDALVSRKIVPMEVRRLRLPQTAAFRKAMERYRESLLFSHFVVRAVAPDVKIAEGDARTYYDAHRSEFTRAPFYKLESIGYRDAKRAQSALAKLRSGTDVKWLKANADEALKPGEGEIDFNGGTVLASTMPAALQALLSGAKKGDYRLFATADGAQTHVLHVLDVTAPVEQPFDEAKEQIDQRLREERVTAALKEWVAKLRQAHPVKVYLTRIGA